MARIPPDLTRCQAEKPNPPNASFMTLGPVRMERCTNLPTVIATESKPDPKDGLRGSMSLCNDCWAVFIRQCGNDAATFEPITAAMKP